MLSPPSKRSVSFCLEPRLQSLTEQRESGYSGTLSRAHEYQVIPLPKMKNIENRKMEGKEGKLFLGILE